HQHVGAGQQLLEHGQRGGLLQVQRQAFLGAVDPDKMRGHAVHALVIGPRKSPTPGRSTLMTRAPRSASWRVQNGAAMACSSETTVMPSRGLDFSVMLCAMSCYVGGEGFHYQAGGSPAARHFLLLRQKKVTKKKAT